MGFLTEKGKVCVDDDAVDTGQFPPKESSKSALGGIVFKFES